MTLESSNINWRFRQVRHVAIAFLMQTIVLLMASAAALAGTIRGSVRGPAGALPDVPVTLLQQGREMTSVTTNARGEFEFQNLSPAVYQVQAVLAPYPPVIKDVPVNASEEASEVAIELAPLSETLTVTAGRIPVPIATSTSDVKIMNGPEIQNAPYQSVDDRLRTFPEFSLFRRSSSLVAQPTTQGVSLRGIGPSGVSRSLVLLNGVPLNDAFGGWVYWDRVPLLSIEQIEIANGGQSSLFGNYGLGGVVQLLKAPPESGTLDFQLQGGSQNSRDFEFLASHRLGPWGAAVSGSFFDFDGYPVVAASQRGAVDIPAFSRHNAMRFTVDHAPASGSLIWSFDGGFLDEHRGNGTPLTPNNTTSFDVSSGLQWSVSPRDQVEVRGFFRKTIFDSNYSSVAADRNSERLTVQQNVPSLDGGAALQWYATRGKSRIALGGDFWAVSGSSADSVIGTPLRITAIRLGGGKQITTGAFVEENYAVSPKLIFVVGGRMDLWRNFDGMLGSFSPGAPRVVPAVPSTTRGVFSPSAGATYSVNSVLSVYGSAYRSFRAPTLNELYRGFTQGNVVTNPNAALVPEHSVGGEAGTRFRLTDNLGFDVAGFINRLESPVSNVTQQTTATQIIRQRQNLGNARIYGVETSLRWRPAPMVRLEAFYLWDRASVTDFSASPALVGNRLPEVPENRATLTAQFALPRGVRFEWINRFVGNQFDDDLNTILLDRYFEMDSSLSWTFSSARFFLNFENMTASKILVTRSPVDFVGTPFSVRGGISIHLHHTK